MLFSLGEADYAARIRELSSLVARIEKKPEAMAELCRQGVGYVFIGAKRDRLPASFDPIRLVATYPYRLLFTKNGASILRTCQ